MDRADEIRALYRDICCATLDPRLARLQATGRFISLVGRAPGRDEIAAIIAGGALDSSVTIDRPTVVERPQRRSADFALSARGLISGGTIAAATSGNGRQD